MIFEFDVVFDVGDEAASFVCVSVFPDGRVVEDVGGFVALVEFCFLYADDVGFLFCGELLKF